MPKTTFVSAGSTTTIKTGAGSVYGINYNAANGAAVMLVDSIGLGASPNMVSQLSNGSNITTVGPFPAASVSQTPTYGAHFQVGLTVATTSNTGVTVYWD